MGFVQVGLDGSTMNNITNPSISSGLTFIAELKFLTSTKYFQSAVVPGLTEF